MVFAPPLSASRVVQPAYSNGLVAEGHSCSPTGRTRTRPSSRPVHVGAHQPPRLGCRGEIAQADDPPRRRARDHRAHRRRSFRRDRPLDRRRLARRATREGRRLALHRAPALQGHGTIRRRQDRRAVRHDGWGAQRRDVTGDDRRLHPCARRPPRRRARRDDGHGVRADARTTSTRSGRSCSRRSRWSTTTRRISSTTSRQRPCSATTH